MSQKGRTKILSINVSEVKEVPYRGGTVTTGIFKVPADGPVTVRKLNIDGDDQADRRVHGGYDMAVYAYPIEHYSFWQKELGRKEFPLGQFGENLTIRGLSEEEARVGDIFRTGDLKLQVTQPRIPCYKLALRMQAGDDFPGRFQQSGRMGFYFRVLEEGEVRSGDQMELLQTDQDSVTIAEFIRTYLYDSHDVEKLERLLRSRDLGDAWRKYLEDILGKVRPVATLEGWQGYRPFVVDRKVKESENITSFHLQPRDGKDLPPFLPGQYLTLKLRIESQSKPVTRTYSISSSPNRREAYRITVKRLGPPPDSSQAPAGIGSSHLHDSVDAGDELSIKAPRGKFVLDPRTSSPIVLLSAGVGLTPLLSMLAAVAEEEGARPVWFVHGTRNGREHALREEVRQLAAGHENIRLHFAYSRPASVEIAGRDFDSQGRITVELLKDILPPAAYDFYLCGPTPFMQELYRDLESWGVPPARIHYEFFGPRTDLSGGRKSREPEPADADWEVSFARSEMTVRWSSEFGNVLELAEAQGLRPDFSCRAGICHTCMVPLIRGAVEYVCDPIDLPDPGHVLICCAKPKTDVVIDV